MFDHPGIYGPVTARPKAAEAAPEIVFAKILHAGDSAEWNSDRLRGIPSVLAFYPDTSHNPEWALKWNALVEQFADKPVQLVWITGENEKSLLPFLRKHPLKGWVFHDPDGATGRSYGMEMPAAVIVGMDGKILGFDHMMLPSAETVAALLEGRTVPHLRAEPPKMPRFEDHKPNFPPSYIVHISPTKHENSGGNYGGMDYSSFQRYDLKDMLAELYGTTAIRILLPSALDDGKRYDFEIVLPEPEDTESKYDRLRKGIDEHFHVATTREERLLDAYVVTSSGGKPPSAPARSRRGGGFSFSSSSSVGYSVMRPAGISGEEGRSPKAVGIGDIRSIDVDGSMDDFCRTLERMLDRPVVNETGLGGAFAFHVESGQSLQNDFLERLRDELHLVVVPAQRRTPVVVGTTL